VGPFFLLRIHCDMTRVRSRLQTLLKTYFTTDDLQGIGLTEEEINGVRTGTLYRWRRGADFTAGLMAVLVVGAILVWIAL
jgi:hypothetical protein